MKKTLKWIFSILFLLIILLVSVPFLFKGKIVAAVKDAANKNIDARLDFKDVDVSLIRSFPKLSIGLEGLQILNNAPFEDDTLISAGMITVSVDIMSVINGKEIIVRSVELDKARINLKVNKDGKANWDIAKPTPPSEKTEQPTTFKASLQRYAISNSYLMYDDRSLDFHMALNGLEHEGSGDFSQDLFTLSTFTKSQQAFVTYEKIPYVAGAVAEIKADLDMDMKGMKFTFKKNEAKLNDFMISVDGFVAMPDTNIDMELKFATPKTDFKTFLSMI
ncbi:MAG: AsmA family protein, partial [Bacteroidota bacterium]